MIDLRMMVLLISVVVGWLTLPPVMAEPTAVEVPVDNESRVIVSGVPDSFAEVHKAIDEAEAAGKRGYRVFVVDRAGWGDNSARDTLDSLIERANRRLAEGEQVGFDPARDVAILLETEGRKIAMRVPYELEKSLGLDTATVDRELLESAFLPRARDGQYARGLADLVAGTERWISEAEAAQVRRAENRRILMTRTLPLAAAGLVALAGVVWLLLARSRRDQRLSEARRRLAAFKRDVMGLSDLLDAQRERHRMLPHADADFATPMEGLTRDTYDQVAAAIRRYRERWLRLMDIWERAESLISQQGPLGTEAAGKAIELLEAADATPPLDEVAGACRGPLDLLERAHERARELAREASSALEHLGSRLDGLPARGRADAALRPRQSEAIAAVEAVGEHLETDPLAAIAELEEAAGLIDALGATVDDCEQTDARLDAAVARRESLTAEVAKWRAEGWLLVEAGANPDTHLARCAEAESIAAAQLDRGEVDDAKLHVAEADHALDETERLLARVAEARPRAEGLLAAVAARLDGLEAAEPDLLAVVEHLAAHYASDAFADVADVVIEGQAAVGRGRRLLAEARSAADPSRQHYFHAVAMLEEAERQADWIAATHAATIERRRELDGLAAELPSRESAVAATVEGLLGQLTRQRTDRVRANEHAREAMELLGRARSAGSTGRFDPRVVTNLLSEAELAAGRAAEFAREDDRLARQAFAEIEEADGLVRRVASWYEEGITIDAKPAERLLDEARQQLGRMAYEEAIRGCAEASRLAREAHAAAAAEARSRRQRRIEAVRRRQLAESFERLAKGVGPWLIQLPGGPMAGPNPWRAAGGGRSGGGSFAGSSRTGIGGWSSRTSQRGW